MKQKHKVIRLSTFFLALTLALALTACGKEEGPTIPSGTPTPPPTETATAKVDPEEAVRSYWKPEQLTQEWGPTQVVEHLFFHPVIAYPEFAFSDAVAFDQQKGLDDWMVTAEEFKKILDSVYAKGYILVRMEDVWSEQANEAGELRMVRNTLKLPEGKKPLIFSFDDVNYYDYMLSEGFMSKLIVGEDGDIWAYGTNPVTREEVLTQDLDATTILDKFVREHPDFSLNGAKGVFSLTGYQGILGYRTQNDIDIVTTDPARAAFDAKRQSEIDAVKPVLARLKETGWTFGSHTWGHIRLASANAGADERLKRDTLRWLEEVGSLVGPTNILFYPHGARPDNDHDQGETYGPQFVWLQQQGFRVFASVGNESYSQVKSTISAVICDRLHPDGTTLRGGRNGRDLERYMKFYDAREIIDLENRPDLGVTWSSN